MLSRRIDNEEVEAVSYRVVSQYQIPWQNRSNRLKCRLLKQTKPSRWADLLNEPLVPANEMFMWNRLASVGQALVVSKDVLSLLGVKSLPRIHSIVV